MNINLERLYAEMKDRPWDGGIQSVLGNLRSKKLTGNFPIPFVKVKTGKKCGVAQLPREDFPIFGIDPKRDLLDIVQCSKCNIRYRLQNVEKHFVEHTKVTRSQVVMESPVIKMNINLEKLYAEMKERPWDGGIQSVLGNLHSKKLTGNFPIPFVKVKTDKECGVAQLPREDFPIFGIDPKRDLLDIVQCNKCNIRYRLQNAQKHLEEHAKVTRSLVMDSPESFSSSSLPSTPTKAQKKEMPKMIKKYTLSPPETIPFTDISSDTDVSSSGDISYPSDWSNLSNNGLVKTELEASVPMYSSTIPVNFSSSMKSKHILINKLKKQNNRDNIKEIRKPPPAPSKLKEYDPNRHCGVCTEENGWSPCLRSLTCKSHPVQQRRNVVGRCKSFDELLLEHKQSKGSKTISCINLANRLAKKKTKESVVIAHPATMAHVQVTAMTTPLPPTSYPLSHVVFKQELEPVIKEEPMDVEETPELPVIQLSHFNIEEPKPLAPLPVIECTTRVRRSKQPPQPLSVHRTSLCFHSNRVFTNAREAYLTKLLTASVVQSSGLKNTININSIKNRLYEAQFFNLVNASTQGQNGISNFIPINNRFNFSQP